MTLHLSRKETSQSFISDVKPLGCGACKWLETGFTTYTETFNEHWVDE
jgi:hypothetical protein